MSERRLQLYCILYVSFVVSVSATYSKIWGEDGDRWKPTSRLPDWSYAGYRASEVPLPRPPIVANVKTFGAVGDGTHDDTDAIQAALASAIKGPRGTVYIPEGRYVIKDRLIIDRSNVVLRGAGMHKTTLYIPTNLAAVDGYTINPKVETPYMWWDAFIYFKGSTTKSGSRATHLANVTGNTPRGYRRLYVDSVKNLKPGSWAVLYMSDPPKGTKYSLSLVRELHNNCTNIPCTHCFEQLQGRKDITWFPSRIESVGPNYVVLERPLPYPVKAIWKPVLHRFNNEAPRDSGVQDLTIEFKWTPNYPHHYEPGHNGVYIKGGLNTFVKNVQVINCDVCVQTDHSYFVTVENILINVTKSRATPGVNGNHQGHIAIGVVESTDVLVKNFRVAGGRWLHDTTFSGCHFNVIKNGKGVDLNMDFHGNVPYANLFSNLQLGLGTRPFTTGGNKLKGLSSASYGTYWNIRVAKPDLGSLIRINSTFNGMCGYGTLMNYIGDFYGQICPDIYLEHVHNLEPVDLHASQLSRRLATQPPPAVPAPADNVVSDEADTTFISTTSSEPSNMVMDTSNEDNSEIAVSNNNFASSGPDVAQELYTDKNETLTPSDFYNQPAGT